MEIIVKSENENDVNKPNEVFNRLYDQLGTRKKCNLQIIHKTCQMQFEIGSKDFSIPTISKLVAEKDGPAEQTLRNSSGADYRTLIDAWAKYANGFTKKNILKKQEKKVNQTLEDDILSSITDSTTRALVGMILAENKNLKKKINAFKSQDFYIDMRQNKDSVEINLSTDSLSSSKSSLILYDTELEALKDAICIESLSKKGLITDNNGRIKFDNGMELFKVGFFNALEKIVENYSR